MTAPRQYRAGQSVEDHCRSCHEDRIHTVIVVDAHAQPLRVACDFCRSEHNYRGGPRSGSAVARSASAPRATADRVGAKAVEAPRAKADHSPLPLVSERERQAPPMSHNSDTDLELLIRRIIR